MDPIEKSFARLQVSGRQNQRCISRPTNPKPNVTVNRDEQLSKTLFYALKNPKELNLSMMANNFLDLGQVLRHPTLVAKRYTFADVERVISDRDDPNFQRFALAKNGANWSIGLAERKNKDACRSRYFSGANEPKRKALFEVLDQAQELGLVESEADFINCTDLQNIPQIKEVQIKLEHIEQILNNAEDPLCGKYIFVRYESGLCKIRKNAYFSLDGRKVKVVYDDGPYSERDLDMAKALAYHLRHRSDMSEMSDDGFIDLAVILAKPIIKNYDCTIVDVKRILSLEEYARYVLIEYEPDRYKIKATHGHTIPRVMAWNRTAWKLETTLSILVHRCNYPSWADLRQHGFLLIKRKWVSLFDPDNKEMKMNREIEISIDAATAREDGVKFFIVPENEHILTEGLNGALPLKYFIKVVDRASDEAIMLNK